MSVFFFKIKIEEALSLSLCLSFYLSHSVQKDFHITIEGPTKVFGHGSRAHNLGNLNDIVEGDIPVVLDILCLLLVTLRLLQCLDDQSHYQWHHRHLGLTILHGQLHRHAQALPVLRGLLRYVFFDLLRRET